MDKVDKFGKIFDREGHFVILRFWWGRRGVFFFDSTGPWLVSYLWNSTWNFAIKAPRQTPNGSWRCYHCPAGPRLAFCSHARKKEDKLNHENHFSLQSMKNIISYYILTSRGSREHRSCRGRWCTLAGLRYPCLEDRLGSPQ